MPPTADRVGLAEETVGLFTREGVDQIDNLVEMQCMWFAQAAGQSFARQGKIGQALKKFHQVEKVRGLWNIDV
jgi:peptide alpha-N-acetyltransferase